MPAADFYRLLQALLPTRGAPWHVPAMAPAVHLLLCVLRVDGLSRVCICCRASPAG